MKKREILKDLFLLNAMVGSSLITHVRAASEMLDHKNSSNELEHYIEILLESKGKLDSWLKTINMTSLEPKDRITQE